MSRGAVERSKCNAKAVIADLTANGFGVESVADLFNLKMKYEAAIPLLLSWLPRIEDSAVKGDVIRALAVSWAKPVAAAPLIKEFRQAASSSNTGLLWTIANTLSVVADDSVFADIVQLVRDRRNGKAREMLALALGNMNSPRAIEILTDLLADDQIVGHVIMALGALKAKSARSLIEKLSHHPKKWIRKEVQIALALIG